MQKILSSVTRGTDVGHRVWGEMTVEVGKNQVVRRPGAKLGCLSFVLKLQSVIQEFKQGNDIIRRYFSMLSLAASRKEDLRGLQKSR